MSGVRFRFSAASRPMKYLVAFICVAPPLLAVLVYAYLTAYKAQIGLLPKLAAAIDQNGADALLLANFVEAGSPMTLAFIIIASVNAILVIGGMIAFAVTTRSQNTKD